MASDKNDKSSITKDLRNVGKIPRGDYNIASYNWSLNSTTSNILVPKNSIQKIIFKEFQPLEIFDVGQGIDALEKGLLGFLSSPTGLSKRAKTLSNFLTTLSKASGAVTRPIIEGAIIDYYLKESNKDKLFDDGLRWIKNLFPGDELYRYEFPFHEDFYIEADTTDGWSTPGSKRIFGESGQKLFKEGMNADFPTTPQWSLGDQKGNNFIFTFYLINDTTENTKRNWNLLTSFVSSCFWIQLGIIQKSPNIFRVVLEGRWEKWWCAVGTNVETMGRLYYDKNISDNIKYPEAYKVTISVKSLVQDNFNTFGNYIKNGSGGKIEIGSRTRKEQLVTQGLNVYDSLKDVTTETTKSAIKKSKELVKNYKNYSSIKD